jgi:type II secretory pathway pseudopilin PulG
MSQHPQPPSPFDYRPHGPGGHGTLPTRPRRGLAIASLIIGIVSLPTFGLLMVGAIVGLVLGIVAVVKAGNQPLVYGGKGLAVGGIVTSAASLLLIPVIGIVAAIAVPGMTRAVRDGREQAAIQALQAIHRSQAAFNARSGRYGTLRELADSGLLDARYATVPVNGYLYYDSAPSAEAYCVRAERERSASGSRDFSINEAGVIYFTRGDGQNAPCGAGTPLADGQEN